MAYTSFPGQRPDEHILYAVQPHPIAEFLGYFAVGFLYIVWTLGSLAVSGIFGRNESVFLILTTCIGFAGGGYGLWWVITYKKETVTFITDKRLVCYRVIRPKNTGMKTVEWAAVEKAQGAYPNAFWKLMHIGSVAVYPSGKAQDPHIIAHVVDMSDLTGYLNHIIVLAHSYPETIKTVRPYELIPRHLRNPIHAEAHAPEEVTGSVDLQ